MQAGLYIRVKQALTWLKRNHGMLQKDIADRMGMSEASFTRALARIKEKYDENFVVSFHSAVNDFISLDYLLNGTGDITDNNKKETDISLPTEPVNHIPDMSSVFNAALAAKDEAIESLKRELQTKNDLIQSLRDQLSTKDQLIEEQKARLVEYRRIINSHENPLTTYPFPVGVSEQPKKHI